MGLKKGELKSICASVVKTKNDNNTAVLSRPMQHYLEPDLIKKSPTCTKKLIFKEMKEKHQTN